MRSHHTRREFLGFVGVFGGVGVAGCVGASTPERPGPESDASTPADDDTIYQVSTIDALMAGSFDGVVTIEELEQHGGFGVGTLQGADGEAIVLDGTTYVVRPDGEVTAVSDDATTPFAIVTDFEDERTVTIEGTVDYDALRERLDTALPTLNTFYAIKIDGQFEYLKTRSVPQHEAPYPSLAAVVERETIFEFEAVSATLVGFRCPAYIAGVNVPGYHFHCLTDDRSGGGHVYELGITDPTVQVDISSKFSMVLPAGGRFDDDGSDEMDDGTIDAIEDG